MCLASLTCIVTATSLAASFPSSFQPAKFTPAFFAFIVDYTVAAVTLASFALSDSIFLRRPFLGLSFAPLITIAPFSMSLYLFIRTRFQKSLSEAELGHSGYNAFPEPKSSVLSVAFMEELCAVVGGWR